MRGYAWVTGAYWAFTLTDGALRMLVLLHFHTQGFSPLQIANLFLFYEFFGIVTNAVGGWLGARFGLRLTLFSGLGLQAGALAMLALLDGAWPQGWTVAWVMAAQALSGIAKDLTKMSAKSAVKLVVPEGEDSALFRWVAVLTGSKNALKGAGFFLGGLLLALLGFDRALWAMAGALLVVWLGCLFALRAELVPPRRKAKFASLFAKSRAINVLSAARFFLFGARDVWFVVGLPVFLYDVLGWGFAEVGGFLALWVIGYGAVQSLVPAGLGAAGLRPTGRTVQGVTLALAAAPAVIALALGRGWPPEATVVLGLAAFGVLFALNSSLHSYLILAYSDRDSVAEAVGFYYMANAGGRLAGTVLSGWLYQIAGLAGCLWASVALVLGAALFSMALPARHGTAVELSTLGASGD